MEAGLIARAQGRHDDALMHFEAAATGAAEPARALVQLAKATLSLGRVPRAVEAARAALAPATAADPGMVLWDVNMSCRSPLP
jgi:hypothetical protein